MIITHVVAMAVVWGSATLPGATEVTIGPPPCKPDPSVRALLENLASEFNASQSGVLVRVAEERPDVPADSLAAGELGDILLFSMVNWDLASPLASQAERGALVPLDQHLADPNFQKDDFFANVWDLVTFQGKSWGVPLTVRSYAIGVDAAMVDPASVRLRLRDWPDLATVLRAMPIDDNADGTPDHPGADLTMPVALLQGLYLRYGGDPNGPGHKNLDSPAWTQAFSAFAAIVKANPMAFGKNGVPLPRPDRCVLRLVHDDPMDPSSLVL